MTSTSPYHVAIIMDGNRRWAAKNKLKTVFGHSAGSEVIKSIIDESNNLGIKILSLFCFSTENWKRPKAEINYLMNLMSKYLHKEMENVKKNNIKLQSFGDLSELPEPCKSDLLNSIEKTKNNTGLVLNFCMNYGGQEDILSAVKSIAKEVKENNLAIRNIDHQLIEDNLFTKNLPDPDLIIRTSGELRLSNFFLWQAAYSEFYFTEKLWPDFTPKDLEFACIEYSKRKRRFGGNKAQTKHQPNL